MSNTSKISFQMEVRRIIEILSNDIYDSPYALLRENIQNAYDAILMRLQLPNQKFIPSIEVNIESQFIRIKDNGLGMDESVVSNNFWKAGSSGKNNEIAQAAGVVGTFGIGAMANFGVCKSLRVITRYVSGNKTIETFVKRESLSISDKCIEMTIREEDREPGTEIIAELDSSYTFTLSGAIDYLKPYIHYVRIPISINGNIISQHSYLDFSTHKSESLISSKKELIEQSGFKFELIQQFGANNLVKLYCSNIFLNKQSVKGDIALSQGTGRIYGLRNYYGLASIPYSGYFNLGGIVNMSMLHPTAGREALSRESIEVVSQLINIIESRIAEALSDLDIADLNTGLLSYVAATSKYSLAKNIKIEVKPQEERLELKNITKRLAGKKVYYYGGRDQDTILSFGNENTYLLILSQDNPRRRIQQEYIKKLGIEEVPDKASILKIYNGRDLAIPEVSLILRLTNILSEDYLIADSKISFADISHKVPSIVTYKDNVLSIYLARNSQAVKQVLQTYDTAYEVFGGFVKDLVRNHLYQKFATYVPSSTKQGADALHKILMKNRELYKYELSDFGPLESLLNNYVSGEIDFPEVLKRSSTITKTHSQYVVRSQVGTVEKELPSIIEDDSVENELIDQFAPLPPIMRDETKTDMKILKTDKPYQNLNYFSLFLGLSDKVYRTQIEFFMEPHTTKVIWGMHKIVYIFTHASRKLSLYYDIELKEKLPDETTGGRPIPTTTILTENRIFIPIINELTAYFDIIEGSKEFYVRYDIITDMTDD